MKKILIVMLVFSFCVSKTFAQKKIAQRFLMPKNALYSTGNVLVKIKNEYKSLFEQSSSSGRTESIIKGVFTSPLVPKAQQEKSSSSRMAPPKVDISNYYQLSFNSNLSVENFINDLYSTGYFELVEPNYIYKSHVVPNDPQASSQYHLQTINAYSAWDIAKGSSNTAVAIAIIDSGGDLQHADLKDNLYTNPNEIPSNGIDDDNNGYIDDVHGWDFIGADTANWVGDNNVQITKGGDISHGTWTSGCASATTNNGIGVAGVAYNTKLLYTKHSGDNQKTTSGSVYNAYAGLLYAANQGIKIINCSFGGTGRSQIVQDLINYVVEDLGCLVVASAGNDGTSAINYPAGYDNVVSVAATDANDKVASFSNRGSTIDISAPGVNILTTGYQSVYQTESGTSFSSPIVAGAAALVWAKNPTFTAQQVAEQLRVTADATALYTANPALTNQLGKGRLDVNRALTLSLPSVRASNLKFANAKGLSLQPSEKGYLTLDFTNYLQATSNLKISITTTSTYVTISNGSINPGIIGTNSTFTNTATPFELTLSSIVPENTSVDLTITYQDGTTYSDVQQISFLINRSFVDINKNNITSTLSGIGRIGFEDSKNSANGNGFIFNGNSMLFEMGLIMGTASTNIFNNVRGVSNGYDQDFSSINKIRERVQGKRSYDEIYGTFNDSPTSGQEKISVSYTSMLWTQSPYNNFVILEYKVKNPTSTAISGFHFGIFADWDISNSGANDAADYDSKTRLGYVYPVGSNKLPLGGIQILTGTPEYYAIDNLDSIAALNSSFGLYNSSTSSFSDTEKFTAISSGLKRLKAGQSNSKGNDVSHVVSSGPYNLAAGQEITIAFALHAANTLNDLTNSAAYADSVYNQILSSAVNVSSCYGSAATINAGNSNSNWYQYPTGGNSVNLGNQLTTGILKNDTVLYISNTGQNSVRIPVNISLKANPTITSSATSFCPGQSATLTVAAADSYLWSTGETTQSIQVKTANNYSVTVKNTALNCTSTSTPITLSLLPSPTASFSNSTPVVLFTPVSFKDQSTNATSWLWDFGDGSTSTAQNPTHSYQTISTPTVKLTVTATNKCTNSITSNISVITGLEDVASQLVIYPNPVISDQLKIEIPSSLQGSYLSILSLTGQTQYSQELTLSSDNSLVEVSVKNFPSGIYFVQVKTKDGLVTKKVIRAN